MELNNLNIKMNQYINNELTGEALLEFEQLLASDPILAKELGLHKKIDRTLMAKKANKNKAEMKALFQQFGEKYIVNPTENKTEAKVVELKPNESLQAEKTNTGVLRWLAPIVGIAAAAMLIFFIGFGDANPKKLAQQYFEPVTIDFASRSGETNNLTMAQQAYDSGNYQKSLSLLNEYPNNTQALMAKGNCEFLLDTPEKAVETFKQLTDKKIDQNIKAQAQWYLALSYLKLEKMEEAKLSLQLISTSSNYYKDAQSLIRKLE